MPPQLPFLYYDPSKRMFRIIKIFSGGEVSCPAYSVSWLPAMLLEESFGYMETRSLGMWQRELIFCCFYTIAAINASNSIDRISIQMMLISPLGLGGTYRLLLASCHARCDADGEENRAGTARLGWGRLHKPPAFAEIPFGGQQADEGEHKRPGVPERFLGLRFDLKAFGVLGQTFEQGGQLFRRDDCPPVMAARLSKTVASAEALSIPGPGRTRRIGPACSRLPLAPSWRLLRIV